MKAAGIACLTALFFVVMPARDAGAGRTSVADYLSTGYTIVEKTLEGQWREGQGAYRDVRRFLHITRYVLERDGVRVGCVMTYDSQNDTIATQCGPDPAGARR